jgi:hypothetical protein
MFRIYEAGTLTVVGFGDDGAPNHFYHPECLYELDEILSRTKWQTIVFDLKQVNCVANGLLGLLMWLRKRGITVQLLNACDAIRTAIWPLKLDVELLREA